MSSFDWSNVQALLEGNPKLFTRDTVNMHYCDEVVPDAAEHYELFDEFEKDAMLFDFNKEKTMQYGRDYREDSDDSDEEPHISNKPNRNIELLRAFTYNDSELIALRLEDSPFIILRKDKEYVIVGEAGSHPLIYTSSFSYDNSDGSGPGIQLSSDDTARDLITKANKYYLRFCLNSYH